MHMYKRHIYIQKLCEDYKISYGAAVVTVVISACLHAGLTVH